MNIARLSELYGYITSGDCNYSELQEARDKADELIEIILERMDNYNFEQND